MNIDFQSKGIFYGDVAKDYAIHRLGFAVGRFADVIRRIDVKVEDINGERGGVDKRCTIKIFVERIDSPIMNSVDHTSISAAIDVACDRIRRSVSRTVDRISKRRTSHRVPLGRAMATEV